MPIKFSSLLPQRFKDTTIDTFLDNTVQKFMTPEATRDVYGWVGDRTNTTDYYLVEDSTERQVNQLVPFIDIKHSTERRLFTFKDIVRKLEHLGIDMSSFADWGEVQTYNFAPPIDYDKFTNYNQYFWIAPTVSGYESLVPQYYTIEVGGTSDWSVENFWVHIDDIGTTDISKCIQGLRPIVEYKLGLESELNSFVDSDGNPSVSGTAYTQKRTKSNQIPLFNTYRQDGVFSGFISGLFYYKEGETATYDSSLERYVQKDSNGDFTFSIGLIDSTTSELLFYKSAGDLKTIWEKSSTVKPKYMAVESPGSILNKDKLVNYSNYYWIGGLTTYTIEANATKAPEYVVIARGGTSVFSNTNFWVHENQLSINNIDKNTVQQAQKPIIEFSIILEESLSEDKTVFAQIPTFKLYDSAGTALGPYNVVTLYSGNVSDSQYAITVDSVNIIQDLISKTGYTRCIKFDNKFVELTSVNELFSTDSMKFVESDPANNDGVWVVPDYMYGNIQNKQVVDFNYADLASHMITVIYNQDYTGQLGDDVVVGSPFGRNKFRKLSSVDFGEGGIIKEYNSDWSLFISLINQENVNIYDIIDFMKNQYNAFTNNIYNYIVDNVPGMIASGDLETSLIVSDVSDTYEYSNGVLKSNTLSVSSDLIDNFFTYFKNSNSLVVNTQTTADDDIACIFNDSTSVIDGMILTLPMLGLSELVKPALGYDSRIGMNVIVHHDGHYTESFQQTVELMKNVANTYYTRSNGQKTPGVVTHNLIPARPFANQFWFDETTSRLFMYRVESDSIDNEPTKEVGKYWYLRDDDKLLVCLKKNSELRWYDVTADEISNYFSKSDPWVEIRIDTLVNTVIQTIETKIYNEIALRNGGSDVECEYTYKKLSANQNFQSLAYSYFNEYANKYDLDLFKSDYDPNNAFTWNYSSLGKNLNIAVNDTYATAWYDIYFALFGTARPDEEPWLLIDQTRDEFFTNLNTLNIDSMSEAMWAYVESEYDGTFLIPVDFATNTLIPPYHPTNVRALLNVEPTNADDRFVFGSNGPVEMAWINSIDFKYDMVKIAFKLYPMTFLTNYWGYETVVLDNGYEINKKIAKRLTNSDFYIHGDVNTSTTAQGSIIAGTVLELDDVTSPIYVELISPNYFRATQSGRTNTFSALLIDSEYFVTDLINLQIKQTYKGMSIGDKFKIEYDSTTGVITSTTYIPATYRRLHGLSQIFAQLLKYKSIHFPSTFDYSAFKNWDIGLGYGFTGLINTDSVQLKADFGYLAKDEDYEIILKKSNDVEMNYVTALYCQLVEKGAYNISSSGVEYPLLKASDWTFKIDGFDQNKKTITVKTFDKTSTNQHQFAPLSGELCTDTYTEYYDIAGEVEYTLPVLITGAQNVLDFVLGYNAYLQEQGFRFNDELNSINDSVSGKLNSWKNEVEKMLDGLWRSPQAGNGFVFNPIKQNLFFKNTSGIVSSFTPDYRNTFRVPYVADIRGRRMTNKHLRVFRKDYFVEVATDHPIYSACVSTDEYEHVALFNDRSSTSTSNILFDATLGIRVPRILVDVKKQLYVSGNLSFGGNYLASDNSQVTNIESTVSGIERFYDSSSSLSKDVLERARNLFGFNSSFLSDMDINPKTKFEFWKGMIQAKGTDIAISAFTNSSKFDDISVDEYWMYKVSEYGDSGSTWSPEIKISDAMLSSDIAKLYFLDMTEDASTVNDSYIKISRLDDDIFYSYDDLNRDTYFTAKVVYEPFVGLSSLTSNIIDVVTTDKKTAYADFVEMIVDGVIISALRVGESDAFIKFVNCSSLQILDTTTYKNNTVQFKFYSHPLDTYGPFEIIDHKNSTVVANNVILWHPIMGKHDPAAVKSINVMTDSDPAVYNASLTTIHSKNYNKYNVWGSKEVGRVWLDTNNLDYIQYFDPTIITSVDDRVTSWGTLAEYSQYSVNQWIESSYAPTEHMKKYIAGELATYPTNKKLYTTSRSWKYTPIAWAFSKNPKVYSHSFIETYDKVQVKYPTSTVGSLLAIDKHTFEYNNIDDMFTIMMYGSDTGVLAGEYRIVDMDKFYVIGNDTEYFNDAFSNTDVFESITIAVPDADAARASQNLGKYKFTTEVLSGITYVNAICTQTGDYQRVVVSDTENNAGVRETYYFDKFGFKVQFKTKYDHSSSNFNTEALRISKIVEMFVGITFTIREAVYAESYVPIVSAAPTSQYFAFFTPTKEDLESDNLSPMNKYKPHYFTQIDLTEDCLVKHSTIIDDDIKTPTTWQNDKISQYEYTLNDWKSVEKKTTKFKYLNNSDTFSKVTITSDEKTKSIVYVYVNGKRTTAFDYVEKSTSYSIKFTTEPSLCDYVVVIIAPPDIDAATLAVYTNIGTNKDSSINTQLYKYDYDYSMLNTYNEDGTLYATKYYFWAYGQALMSYDGSSLPEIKTKLMTYSSPYAMLIEPTGKTDALPVRYKGVVTHGLKLVADKIDTYKIRFVYEHFVRSFEMDMAKKNIHTEWKLIKKTMIDSLPTALWTKFVDSIVGYTSEGVEIPSPSRVRYDQKHGTKIQYGFGTEQTLMDSTDAKSALVYYIQELDKYTDGGLIVEDFDLTDFIDNIDDPDVTRKYLNILYTNMKTTQLNDIFFSVIELGLAYNYVFTDLVKTSYISIVSNKTLKVYE